MSAVLQNPASPLPASGDLNDLVQQAVREQIGPLVHETISKEEERRFRQLKWIVAFLGVIGLGTFGTLANFVIEKVVDAKAGNIREALELTRINALALKLTISDSFSNDDRDESMALLARIATLPAVKASPEVKTTLVDILKAFAEAGLGPQIDELFRLYRDEILGRQRGVEVLLHHYGQEIGGRSAAPSHDDFYLRSFEALERVAEGHKQGELALAYRTVYDYKIGPTHPDVRIERLIRRSLTYSDMDATRFLNEILLRTRVSNWQKRTTPPGHELERVTRGLFGAYSGVFAAVYGVPVGVFRQIAADGIARPEAEKLATRLVEVARASGQK